MWFFQKKNFVHRFFIGNKPVLAEEVSWALLKALDSTAWSQSCPCGRYSGTELRLAWTRAPKPLPFSIFITTPSQQNSAAAAALFMYSCGCSQEWRILSPFVSTITCFSYGHTVHTAWCLDIPQAPDLSAKAWSHFSSQQNTASSRIKHQLSINRVHHLFEKVLIASWLSAWQRSPGKVLQHKCSHGLPEFFL